MSIRQKLPPPQKNNRKGFTLIELLVVIAIIAILSVVVILVLNPADLLRQSRDSGRLSDMATLNSALGFYAAQGGISFGNSSTTYVSIPDPSATSTQGDQCQGLGLPSLPTGDTYQCSASSSFRNTGGTGWIPVNFSSISAGSPLGSLPIDPADQSSSNLFYTYTTNGSQFEVTSLIESQKYKLQFGNSPQDPGYPEVLSQGSNLSLSELFSPSGLVGYWPLNEGSGTTAVDASGNGNTGSWSGTQAGSSGYYSGGKVGTYAGAFDGSTDYVGFGNAFSESGSFSISAWAYPISFSVGGNNPVVIGRTHYGGNYQQNYMLQIVPTTGNHCSQYTWMYQTTNNTGGYASVCGPTVTLNQWILLSATYSAATGIATLYVNGQSYAIHNGAFGGDYYDTETFNIGGYDTQPNFPGLIDDVRIYNRALSAAEIQALYNAEK